MDSRIRHEQCLSYCCWLLLMVMWLITINFILLNNYYGQLGLGHTTNLNTFTSVSGMNNVTDIAANAQHGYVVNNNQLYSVGYNDYGQLGLGHTLIKVHLLVFQV